MSRVLDVLKKAPAALQKVDQSLPQSDKGLNFPGKGFLTALVDTSGSELKRQTKQEDELKHAMVQPLIEKYWQGDLSDEERQAVADQIKKTLGGGKNTKATLDRIFEVGGQIHATNKMLKPPPGASDAAAGQAVQAAATDQAGPEEGAFDTTGVLQPPPAPTTPQASTPQLSAPPVVGAAGASAAPVATATPTSAPAGGEPAPATAGTVTSPLSSALTKMYPAGMSEREKIELQHKNTMALEKARTTSAMELMQSQIDAGRFEKNLKAMKGTEVDPATGKTMSVLRWYSPDGTLVKKDVLAEAPRNWASKPTRIFARDEEGQIFSEMVDPLTGQRMAGTDRRYDILPPAGYLDKVSSREAIFVDEDNIVHLEPLTTIRKVQLPPAPGAGGTSPLAPPPTGPSAALPGSAGGGATAGAAANVSPGARPGAAAPATTPRTLPGVYTPGIVAKSIDRATPIREAYTSMIGSPDEPDAPSFMKYAKIADDPVRRAKLGKALELTFQGIEQDEKAHGSLVNLFKLYAGIPAAEVNAQLATYGDIVGEGLKDDPELQQAYNATMTLFGNAVALRALTKAGVAQSNVKRIEQEIPVFDKNTFNSRDVAGKLYGLLRTARNGMQGVVTIPKKERDFVDAKMTELNRINMGTGIQPPPGSTATAPIYAVNKTTKERLESTDGGKTWHKPK